MDYTKVKPNEVTAWALLNLKISPYIMGTASAKAELVKFMKIRAGYQMGPVNSSPLASLAARKFPRLFLLSTDQSHPSLLNQFKLLCNSLHYRPELLLSPQAPKKLKAVAEDADTTKDSDDTAAYAEEDEADLDQVEDIFVTTKILTDYSMADHEITKKSNSYWYQAVPSTVFKCLGQENLQSRTSRDVGTLKFE